MKLSILALCFPLVQAELVTLNIDGGTNNGPDCTTLRFTQESAPQKLSDIHRSLTEAVNRERTGSELKLDVEWTGDFKDRRPGEYVIMAKVGGKPRCYRYLIEDVDECAMSDKAHAAGVAVGGQDRRVTGGAMPQSKEWFHQCHSSAECLNKNGTYECQCPYIERIGRRATPMPSKWPCEGKASTGECCEGVDTLTHSQCKREFVCHTSVCARSSTCEPVNGQCVDSFNASGYSCQCRPGFVGNGHTCTGANKKGFTVLEDEETGELTFIAADQTLENDASRVCGCNRPIKKGHCRSSDCCGGEVPCNEECATDGHGCQCKSDFENTTISVDAATGSVEWACVDPTPPKVRLLDRDGNFIPIKMRKHVVRVTQFQAYEDFGYDVDDDNKDKDMRKFEMRGEVPQGLLFALGTHNVTFKTWTGPNSRPWSSHSVTREIHVVNANECQLSADTIAQCPECAPRCDAAAKCADEDGSYACVCPSCGRNGDGFLPIAPGDPLRPPSYRNGSGCQDSCPPIITLKGDATKVFTVCKCDGPLCPSPEVVDWDARVRAMIANTPDEICPKGAKFPCAVALDPTIDGKGVRDISSRIVVGEPEHLSGLAWKIPLNVRDESGNKATTVFREIHVKEMSIDEIEEQALAKTKQVQLASTKDCTCPKPVEPLSRSPPPPPTAATSGTGDKTCPPCICQNDTRTESPCPPSRILSTSNEPFAWLVLCVLLVSLYAIVRCCIFLIPEDAPSNPVHRARPPSAGALAAGSASQPPQHANAGRAVTEYEYSPWQPHSPRPPPAGF